MIKPASLLKRTSIEEPQCVTRAFERRCTFDPATFDRDADSSQTKTSGRNARDVLMTRRQRRSVHSRAIEHEPRLRICLFPEVAKRSLLKIVEERFMLLLRAERKRSNDDESEERSASYPWYPWQLYGLTSNFASITSAEFEPTITRNSPGSTTNRISRFQKARCSRSSTNPICLFSPGFNVSR